MIIPPSTKYDVPGADDATILRGHCTGVGRDADQVRSALARLHRTARAVNARRQDVRAVSKRPPIACGTAEHRDRCVLTVGSTLLCYYRDDRVMLSAFGLEPSGHRSRRDTQIEAGRLVAAGSGAIARAILAAGILSGATSTILMGRCLSRGPVLGESSQRPPRDHLPDTADDPPTGDKQAAPPLSLHDLELRFQPTTTAVETRTRQDAQRVFSVPVTTSGRSTLATLPPWHYSSDCIAIEYWADPGAIAADRAMAEIQCTTGPPSPGGMDYQELHDEQDRVRITPWPRHSPRRV